MTDADVLDITQDMVWCILKCAAPLLLVSLIVGLIISIFQTATSIQEQTLTFVPKALCVFLGLVVFGDWILGQIVNFMTVLWSNFSLYVG